MMSQESFFFQKNLKNPSFAQLCVEDQLDKH